MAAYGTTAAETVGSYISAQVEVIRGRDPQVRVDGPDSVHKTRVATRRLRSTLRTFRELMDRQAVDALRCELKWYAQMLGGPRDAEVLKDRLLASLADLPPEAVVGPVEQRLAEELNQRHAQAHAELVTAMDSARYRSLVRALNDLALNPPFLPTAAYPADQALKRPLKKSAKRVERRWTAAGNATGQERTELTHETRKKAKAARYAFEAVAEDLEHGADAAAAWEQVTEALGVAQDTVVARARLLELAALAFRSGEPTFTYGVLYQRELASQQDAEGSGGAALDRAVRLSTQ